jgi:hypothetical protein
MQFDFEAIARLSAEASKFSSRAQWHFKARPVLSFEFSTLSDFARAQMDLMQAVSPVMIYAVGWERRPAPHIFEVDCLGITFRLICTQVVKLPDGSALGASEVKFKRE